MVQRRVALQVRLEQELQLVGHRHGHGHRWMWWWLECWLERKWTWTWLLRWTVGFARGDGRIENVLHGRERHGLLAMRALWTVVGVVVVGQVVQVVVVLL